MGSEGIRLLVDTWTIAWSVMLLSGYFAERTPFPALLKMFREPGMAKLMLISSAAVVLGLTLGGAREASAILTAWAIVVTSVKLLYDSLGQEE